MQGSKQIERAVRTRTKITARAKTVLDREQRARAIKARAVSARMTRPLRRALASVGAI